LEDAPSNADNLVDESSVQGSLSEIINIYPGDRIAVINSPQANSHSHQLSLLEPDLSIVNIVDCWNYAKMLGFMEHIEMHPDGFPIPFGNYFDEKPPAIVREVHRQILNMGAPDVFSHLDYTQSLNSQ
jgi:hypothetical protein